MEELVWNAEMLASRTIIMYFFFDFFAEPLQ